MVFTPNARTAPTIVSGTRDPQGGVPSQRIVPDVRDEIVLWEPNVASVTVLTKKLKNKLVATQREFQWIEEEPYPRTLTVSGAQTSGDTSIEVVAGEGSRVTTGCLLRNTRTGEVLRVSSVSTDTLTVVRGIGSSGGAAMNDGDRLLYFATAHADGSLSQTAKTVKGAREYNYTQFFRTPFELTDRQANTQMYGGRDIKTTGRQAAIEHRKDMEYALFFGRRYNDAAAGGETSTTGGLDQFIASNIWDLNGVAPSENAFVDFLEAPMRWGMGGSERGNGSKILVGSPRWMSQIDRWYRDRIRVVDAPEIKRLGLAMTELVTPHGNIMLLKQPLFTGDDAGLAYLVDLNHIFYRYHEGLDTALHMDIQENDRAGVKHEWRTDMGWEIQVEAAHAKIQGLPAAA